ncbi:MAG: T9SS C-terminal target domain-containing protein, partial [Methanobacteriota archaeon]
VIGLMFTGPDSIVVQNLVNDSYHTDDLLSLPDRTLHLINTRVGTWNLYPFGNSIITVENCIFGELIASDSSRTVITNSLCDGSGGYLGVESDAELVVVQSLINSQVLSSDNSILIAAQSAFNTLDVVSTDASIMVLFNTLHLSEPQLFDASTVFEGFLPPLEGEINSEIPLIGTARILTGPLSPFQFVGYSVEWSQEFENPIWHPTDGMHSEVVVNDTLAIWDTHNLNPDTYALKLNLFHNFGDSLGLITWAQLEEPVTGVGSKENTVPETISLDNFPNPFNPTTTIYFTLPQNERVTLEVFNILGEKIATLVSGELTPGIHRVIWNAIGYPSGVYLYRLETEEGVEKIGKMMLLK